MFTLALSNAATEGGVSSAVEDEVRCPHFRVVHLHQPISLGRPDCRLAAVAADASAAVYVALFCQDPRGRGGVARPRGRGCEHGYGRVNASSHGGGVGRDRGNGEAFLDVLVTRPGPQIESLFVRVTNISSSVSP